MIFKTVPDVNKLSGLSIKTGYQIKKQAAKDFSNTLKSDVQALNEYAAGINTATNKSEFFEQTLGKASKDAKDFAPQIKNGTNSVNEFKVAQEEAAVATKGVGVASKVAAVGIKALRVAANVAIVTLISWGIEKLYGLSQAQQKSIDKTNELTSTYNTTTQTINSNIDNLQGLQSQFQTLSQGVDENGKNIGLTKDQFKQYHDIVKQIVDIDPQLIKGFDDQHNAIVNNNTALQTAIQYEKQELEIKKQAYLVNAKDVLSVAQGEVNKALGNINPNGKNPMEMLSSPNLSKQFLEALTGMNTGANSLTDILAKADKELSSFGIKAKDITSNNIPAITKLSALHDEIVAKLKSEGKLNDTQATQLNDIINKIGVQANAIDTAHQKVVALVDVWSSGKDWFDDISSSGNLDVFNKAIQHFVEQNPTATIQQIEYAAKGLGTSFAGIEPSIDAVNSKVAELKKQQSEGKIKTDQFNKGINEQATTLSNLASSLASTNPLLAYFLNLLAQGLQDSLKDASKSGTDFSDTLKTVDSEFNNISQSMNDYAKSVKDLNDAIDIQNKGDLLTGEQVSVLIQQYPQLTDAIIDTGNGYKFKAGALEDVRKEQIREQETSINAAIADAQNTINSVLKQINAYSDLIGTIRTVADAKAALAKMTDSPISGNRFLAMTPEEAAKAKAARKLLNNYIGVSGTLSKDQNQLNSLKKQLNLIGKNHYEKVDNSDYKRAAKSKESAAKKAESAAKKAAEAAKKAAEERKKALQDEYQQELSNIEAYKEMGKYSADKYGVEGLGYYRDLSNLYNKWKNSSALDHSTKLSLQKEVYNAHKDYEQNVLDVSKQELQTRIDTGKVEENSINHLNSLYQIQHLINSSSMSLVKTRSNQLEIEKEIYSVQKAYAQNMIDESYRQLEHRQNLGMVSGNAVLQNLLDIQRLLTHGKTAQLANTESNRWQIEEKIYDQKKQNLETDINDVDKQVQLGKLQENSIDYLNKLYAIKQQIGKSDLNAIDKASELESINEKIYSAQKSYADGIMSKSYQQLSHRQALGIQYDDRRTDDVYGDKGILQNLLDIQRLLAHGKTAQPANTEENRWQVEEKIYDQKKKILDDDEKDLDTQVQLGLIQENSFDYISKLYDIKQEIEKSDLNSIDRAEKLNEINEKIYSASKNYIEQEMQDEKEKNDNNLQAIKDQISLQEKALEQEEDAHNHNESLTDKEKAVSDIKAELTAIKNDHSDATTAKRLQLQDKLTDANKQLSNYEYSYSISQQKNELSDLSDRYDKEYKTKSKNLEKEQKAKDMALAHEVESIDRISKQILDIHSKTLNQMGSKVQSYYMNVINLTEKYNKIQNDNLNALKEFNYENNRYSDNKLSNNDHNNNKNAIPSMSNVAITPTATVNITNGDFVTTQDNLLNKMRNNLVQLGNDCIKYGQNTNVNFAEGIDNNKDATVLTTQDTLLTDMSDSIRKFIENSINYGENTDTNFSTGINNKSEEPKKSVKDIIAFLKDSESNYISDNIKYGENADINFANGIDSKAKNPIQSVTNVINSLENVDEKYVSDNSTYGKTSDNNLGNGINGNINAPKSAVSKVTNTLGQQFQSFVNSCINYGRGIDNELNAGINDAAIQKRVIATTKSLSDKVVKQFKESFGIHSPSRVMYQIGLYLIQGLINGMSAKDVQSFINSQLGNIISNITESGASAIGHGVERWRSIAATALTLTGHYSPRNLDLLMRQMNTESGGDPNSINLWDINAKEGHPSQGLMQVIPSTFKSYAMKGYDKNILDPLSNIIAAIRYTWSRYGDAAGVWGQGHGYASGTENSTEGWANTDEKGLEYKFLPAKDGQFTWLEAGSHIIDADKVKNLELWGNLNPQTTVLRAQLTNDANRMTGAINSTINNNHTPINIDNSIHVDGGTVDEEMYQKLQGLANNTVGKTLKAMKTMRLGTGVVKPIFNV